ncbi:MAG: cysteine hydrolase family protein [Candidatus Acidiferrales bacterium]
MPARRPVIFWDVDTQVDFISPDGKLYVPGAEKLIPNWKRLTDFAAQKGILVVGDVCAHLPDDEEFKVYPPHCLAGTPGQQKIPETILPRQYLIPNRQVELRRDLSAYQQVILEKQTLDVFSNPNTEALLGLLGREPEVVVYGVVTECCVDLVARGLLQRGYRVRLVTDATRHWDEGKARGTLKLVEDKGELITTDQALADYA